LGFKKIIRRCFEHTPHDPKPVLGLLGKQMEETGELAEATLHSQGYLPHKTMKEPLVGEVADVILCAIALYARLCDEEYCLSIDEGMEELKAHLDRKMTKWQTVAPVIL